jgi:hypothetical protein
VDFHHTATYSPFISGLQVNEQLRVYVMPVVVNKQFLRSAEPGTSENVHLLARLLAVVRIDAFSSCPVCDVNFRGTN